MRSATNHLTAILGIAVVVSALGASPAKDAKGQNAGTLALETAADRYLFDSGSGRLVSLRAKRAPDVELLAPAPDHPARTPKAT